jgi:hypothetical protein
MRRPFSFVRDPEKWKPVFGKDHAPTKRLVMHENRQQNNNRQRDTKQPKQ